MTFQLAVFGKCTASNGSAGRTGLVPAGNTFTAKHRQPSHNRQSSYGNRPIIGWQQSELCSPVRPATDCKWATQWTASHDRHNAIAECQRPWVTQSFIHSAAVIMQPHTKHTKYSTVCSSFVSVLFCIFPLTVLPYRPLLPDSNKEMKYIAEHMYSTYVILLMFF